MSSENNNADTQLKIEITGLELLNIEAEDGSEGSEGSESSSAMEDSVKGAKIRLSAKNTNRSRRFSFKNSKQLELFRKLREQCLDDFACDLLDSSSSTDSRDSAQDDWLPNRVHSHLRPTSNLSSPESSETSSYTENSFVLRKPSYWSGPNNLNANESEADSETDSEADWESDSDDDDDETLGGSISSYAKNFVPLRRTSYPKIEDKSNVDDNECESLNELRISKLCHSQTNLSFHSSTDSITSSYAEDSLVVRKQSYLNTPGRSSINDSESESDPDDDVSFGDSIASSYTKDSVLSISARAA